MLNLGLRSFSINTPGLKWCASGTLVFSCSDDDINVLTVADRGLRFDSEGLSACTLLLLTSLEDFGSPTLVLLLLCLFCICGEFLGDCFGDVLGDFGDSP